MKKLISKLENIRLVYSSTLIGVLLIIFPKFFTGIAPYLVGIMMILYSFVNFILLRRYPGLAPNPLMEGINPGRSFVLFVLGAAILYWHGKAIGPIGSLWAAVTLYESATELNEMVHEKHFPPIQVLIMLALTGLAIMLLFDPEEHFTFHVRILGIEIILAVAERVLHDRTRKAA